MSKKQKPPQNMLCQKSKNHHKICYVKKPKTTTKYVMPKKPKTTTKYVILTCKKTPQKQKGKMPTAFSKKRKLLFFY